MPNQTLVQCPRCNKNWVDEEDGVVCVDCVEPHNIDLTVLAVHQYVQEVDKLNFNKFTSQHKTALRSALTHLEAIINVLERYPK